jgi:Holliday junction resolvasome RuvABC endonuclease subunit
MALGIRVEAETVLWAVVEGSTRAPVLVADGKIPAPVAEDEAGKLVAQRRAVLDVIGKYTPTVVFVRFPETVFASRGETPRKRSRIEGVIMEAAASRAIPVRTGPLSTIGKGLGVDA